VDRIYAPTPSSWYLTKDGEFITVQQFDATADGSELSKDYYKLWLPVSFLGYSEGGARAKYDTCFDGIAEGERLDKWEVKYGQKAQELLDAKLSRDQEKLRKRRRASAHFAVLPDLMASMKEGERVTSAAVGKMLKRKGTTPQRAYQAWSRQAAAAEAREVDVVVCERARSAVSSVGKPGVAAPTVQAPLRDMRMPTSIKQAISCATYGPQWREAIANEWAGPACKARTVTRR
jgi:hypothetical protein